MDNVEKIEGDYSTQESRRWWAELDAQAQSIDHRQAQVNTVRHAMAHLMIRLNNAELCQVLHTISCHLIHMPAAAALVDECHGLVEGLE
jgi:hypothetical protein